MIEVELKCELSPGVRAKLQKKLQHMRFEGVVHHSDVYYDTYSYDLLQQAVFVRVRDTHRVEFKFNDQAEKEHGQSTERVFPLPLEPGNADKMNGLFRRFLPPWSAASSWQEAVTKNALLELVRIENIRQAYAGDDVYVSVDHVEGLGDFLEVETRCEEETEAGQARARLQSFVADLAVEHIKVGYVELWLRLHNPQAYALGKYRL